MSKITACVSGRASSLPPYGRDSVSVLVPVLFRDVSVVVCNQPAFYPSKALHAALRRRVVLNHGSHRSRRADRLLRLETLSCT